MKKLISIFLSFASFVSLAGAATNDAVMMDRTSRVLTHPTASQLVAANPELGGGGGTPSLTNNTRIYNMVTDGGAAVGTSYTTAPDVALVFTQLCDRANGGGTVYFPDGWFQLVGVYLDKYHDLKIKLSSGTRIVTTNFVHQPTYSRVDLGGCIYARETTNLTIEGEFGSIMQGPDIASSLNGMMAITTANTPRGTNYNLTVRGITFLDWQFAIDLDAPVDTFTIEDNFCDRIGNTNTVPPDGAFAVIHGRKGVYRNNRTVGFSNYHIEDWMEDNWPTNEMMTISDSSFLNFRSGYGGTSDGSVEKARRDYTFNNIILASDVNRLASYQGAGAGLGLTSIKNLSVTGITFDFKTNEPLYAIQVTDCKNASLAGISGSTKLHGLFISDSQPAPSNNVSVSGISISAGFQGIYLLGASGVDIESGYIRPLRYLAGAPTFGVRIENSTNVTLANLHVNGMPSGGIRFDGTNDLVAFRNLDLNNNSSFSIKVFAPAVVTRLSIEGPVPDNSTIGLLIDYSAGYDSANDWDYKMFSGRVRFDSNTIFRASAVFSNTVTISGTATLTGEANFSGQANFGVANVGTFSTANPINAQDEDGNASIDPNARQLFDGSGSESVHYGNRNLTGDWTLNGQPLNVFPSQTIILTNMYETEFTNPYYSGQSLIFTSHPGTVPGDIRLTNTTPGSIVQIANLWTNNNNLHVLFADNNGWTVDNVIQNNSSGNGLVIGTNQNVILQYVGRWVLGRSNLFIDLSNRGSGLSGLLP